VDGWTYGRIFETHFIRSTPPLTRRSRPNKTRRVAVYPQFYSAFYPLSIVHSFTHSVQLHSSPQWHGVCISSISSKTIFKSITYKDAAQNCKREW